MFALDAEHPCSRQIQSLIREQAGLASGPQQKKRMLKKNLTVASL